MDCRSFILRDVVLNDTTGGTCNFNVVVAVATLRPSTGCANSGRDVTVFAGILGLDAIEKHRSDVSSSLVN